MERQHIASVHGAVLVLLFSVATSSESDKFFTCFFNDSLNDPMDYNSSTTFTAINVNRDSSCMYIASLFDLHDNAWNCKINQ